MNKVGLKLLKLLLQSCRHRRVRHLLLRGLQLVRQHQPWPGSGAKHPGPDLLRSLVPDGLHDEEVLLVHPRAPHGRRPKVNSQYVLFLKTTIFFRNNYFDLKQVFSV